MSQHKATKELKEIALRNRYTKWMLIGLVDDDTYEFIPSSDVGVYEAFFMLHQGMRALEDQGGNPEDPAA